MKFTVKGKSTNALLNLSNEAFNSLSRRDLARVVSRLGDTANKRLDKIEKLKMYSPATRQFERVNNRLEAIFISRFSVKGKTLNQLRAEYARVKNFLEAQTSTIKGIKEWQKASIKGLQDEGVNITFIQELNEIDEAMAELKELNPDVENYYLRYKVMEEIRARKSRNMGLSAVELALQINREIETIYQKGESENVSETTRLFEKIRNKSLKGFGKNY